MGGFGTGFRRQTDDIINEFINDGYAPAVARQLAQQFTQGGANNFDKYGSATGVALSLFATDQGIYPGNNAPPGPDVPGRKLKMNKREVKFRKDIYKFPDIAHQKIKTENPATRKRVVRALITKREKRLAKEQKKIAKKFKIGCAFEGLGFITEYEDDMIYIPPSDYCFIRCIEKACGVAISRVGLNPYGNSLNKLRMQIKDVKLKSIPDVLKINFSIKDVPKVINIDDIDSDSESEDETQDDDVEVIQKFVTVNKAKQINKKFKILLINISSYEYHAVLVKVGANVKVDSKIYEHIKDNIDYSINLELCEDQIRLRKPDYKKPIDMCVVFDIETSSFIEANNDINEDTFTMDIDVNDNDRRIQEIEGVSYSFVNFGTSEIIMKIPIIGDNCYSRFLDQLCADFESDTILLYSHNGGNFDNIFAKGMMNLQMKKQIKKGGIKKLEAIHIETGKKLIFLDSYSFLKASLERCGEYFPVKNKKMKFDIVNKDHDFFINTTEWIPYMDQDVRVLSEILIEFEKIMRSNGESITSSVCGISSIGWNMLSNRCYGLGKVYRAKDPTTVKFMCSSIYGGRIIHNKKIFDCVKEKSDGLICIDGNALYPSAMYIGMYPIGNFKIIPKISLELFLSDYLNNYLFIAEVTFDAGNVRYPLLPYRTEKGCIIYPNGIFTGVYTSVDILEALNDGYKLLEFKKGVYWIDCKKIFSSTIKEVHDTRRKLQKDNNPMEYVYKIIMNSFYGYTTLSISETTIFSDKQNPELKPGNNLISSNLLNNGQYEHSISYSRPMIDKPVHLGAFITSYARKIMNNYIRKIGPENIWYGDCDSLYVPIELLKNIKESDDLCGVKNDYGSGLLIKYGLFLDIKRYYVEFNKKDKNGLDYKAKFNGLNFKNDNCLQNWISNDDKDKKIATKKLYEWFYTNPNKLLDIKIIQERWLRNKDNVIINSQDMQYQVNPDVRYTWDDNISYPKKLNNTDDYVSYDIKNTKYIQLGPLTYFQESNDYNFEYGPSGIFSAMPLTYDKLMGTPKEITMNTAMLNFNKKGKIDEKFRTTFIKSKITNKMYKRIGDEYYLFDNTKVKEKTSIEDIGEYEELIIIPHEHPYPKLTKDEVLLLLSGIETFLI